MNEAADHRTAQELSRLGEGLAAHVSVPPVMRVIRRATPLRRALFRLEDVAADAGVPLVTRLIRLASARRRALVAGCSICALGAVGAALIFIPGASNGLTGPSELWAQQAGGPDSASQPSLLTMPQLSNDQVAQYANQEPTAQAVAPQPAPAKPAAPVPAAAKPATTNTAAATRVAANTAAANTAAANTAAANAAAARQLAAQSQATQLTRTVTTRTVLRPSVDHATAATQVTLTASVTETRSATLTGTVQFTVDGTLIGSPSVANASIVWTPTSTSTDPGPHKLSAVFIPTTANVSSSRDTVTFTVDLATTTTSASQSGTTAASLAAANTNGRSTRTVTPAAPPASSLPPSLSRGGRSRSGPPSEPLQQQAPAYQLPQQAPAEQLPAQGSSRHR
jgi:hypothetical protein